MSVSARPMLGLRGRVIVWFALGAGFISLVFAVSVFTLSRSYMVDQRERSSERQSVAHAELVRASLSRPDTSARRLISSLETPVDTYVLVQWDGQWYSSNAAIDPEMLPAGSIRAHSGVADRTTVHTRLRGRPYLATTVPLGSHGALYELAPLAELQATLRLLAIVLTGCAATAAVGGALLGWQASRRVLTPLQHVAETAMVIAGGDLDRRLMVTGDRELAPIVDSFNTMVDSLHERIERERRFFGDVSHELRTPLTTLTAAVGVLSRHAEEMSARSQQALSLISAELHHLRWLLDDLLMLARMEAGLHQDLPESVALSDLLQQTLKLADHPVALLTVEADAVVEGRRKALERAFLNLVRNADRHAGGLRSIRLGRGQDQAVIWFDDAGPGVPVADRQRIFERFATGHIGRKTTSGGGTGIGLAMVAESISAHHGTVRCMGSPLGGARFEVILPLSPIVTGS